MIKATLTSRETSRGARSLERAETAFRRFGFALTAHASNRLLDLNLTIPQLRIIKTVERLGRASGRQLADEFGVSPAAIVPVCDRLEAMGFVRRVRDTTDRRILWFELTESGAGILDIMSASMHSRIKPAIAALSESDREALIGILDALAGALNALDTRGGADGS